MFSEEQYVNSRNFSGHTLISKGQMRQWMHALWLDESTFQLGLGKKSKSGLIYVKLKENLCSWVTVIPVKLSVKLGLKWHESQRFTAGKDQSFTWNSVFISTGQHSPEAALHHSLWSSGRKESASYWSQELLTFSTCN